MSHIKEVGDFHAFWELKILQLLLGPLKGFHGVGDCWEKLTQVLITKKKNSLFPSPCFTNFGQTRKEVIRKLKIALKRQTLLGIICVFIKATKFIYFLRANCNDRVHNKVRIHSIRCKMVLTFSNCTATSQWDVCKCTTNLFNPNKTNGISHYWVVWWYF